MEHGPWEANSCSASFFDHTSTCWKSKKTFTLYWKK